MRGFNLNETRTFVACSSCAWLTNQSTTISYLTKSAPTQALGTSQSMSKQDDPMDIDSDSDISIDLEATSKSKGKSKTKINDKRKVDKRKGKAKDTVSLPQCHRNKYHN